MTALRRPTGPRPSVAVWKLSSCDGCQLALLDAGTELLALAEAVDLAWFPEAGPADEREHYDLSVVEGSVTTAEEAEVVAAIRRRSDVVVAAGACATSGGVQSHADGIRRERAAREREGGPVVLLPTCTPLRDHVRVDAEAHGCPVSRRELLEVVSAWLAGREPVQPEHALCVECRQHGFTCVVVGEGRACLGPVTRAGCGALCPSCGRGCYGCFGPAPGADVDTLVRRLRELGLPDEEIADRLRMVTPREPAFARAALRLEVAP